jgi:hypothetical protein
VAREYLCVDPRAARIKLELGLLSRNWWWPTRFRWGSAAVRVWVRREHDDAGLLETIGVEVWSRATMLKLGALQVHAKRARDDV